ncbi:Xaa-Pro dipeptidyl-peptidase [Stieleria varia]|uniref:Xaa-Pro dipeptidyl-peptidase n=1 Tax=Stieleria varia TaxID=2528005 RepID=A0A5C6A3F9_9BACT|nr:Xaa-Pro dipeptidyl-peptidase [Stieleria varia]TWT93798.1 Xaa-Pro dipeptidyl-peptidase [Stieleria varia]
MKSTHLICFLFLGVLCCHVGSSVADDGEPVGPVFKDGEAQVVEAFKDPAYWLRHDLWVETEFDTDGDGKPDRMHVSVTRPAQTETEGLKLPVVYVSSPYFAGVGVSGDEYFWSPRQELGATPPKREIAPPVKRTGTRPIISKSHTEDWVPRGYIVVHSSSPGTGLSQGCPTVGGDNESLAPKAVIDWLCGRGKGFSEPEGGQPVHATWSTGKVGMTGTSYNGTIPLAAATTGVDGLEAIIPVAPNTSYYHYYRSNGLVRHPGGYMGEDIDVLYEFIHSGLEANRDYCDCNVRDELMLKNLDRETGDYNDFWASRDYLNDLQPLKAAVLMAHAFNDWNVVPEHSVRIYEAVKEKGVPCQVFFHQGGHGGPPPMKLMNRWFTRYLHGVQNDVEKDPKSWIVRESDKRENPTSYVDYPHPDSQHVPVHMIAGSPGQGTLSMEAPSEQPLETLIDNFSFDGASLAKAESTQHRLIYVTPELTTDLHLSGTPKITVRMACDQPAANLSVWMVSLPWNDKKDAKITDNIITRGWADPQNQESIRKSAPLEPGRLYDVSFALQPDDQVIPAGQKIGLMIFSSDKEFTLHPKPGTKLTIDPNKTTLSLPVVGGKEALQTALMPSAE